MKLFAIYIGGAAEGANIELHDMRFAVGERIEDTYVEVKRQWWGIPKSLHLDCWATMDRADGHRIHLERTPAEGKSRLYYVNVGGYDPNQFTELHQNLFVVAESEQKAKVRALKQVKHWQSMHMDELFEAEQVIALTDMHGWFVHLTPDEQAGNPSFTCMYKRI